MNRIFLTATSLLLLLAVMTGCNQNPTTPQTQDDPADDQFATEFSLAKSAADEAAQNLPAGLDKQPVTALPYWARVEPPIPDVGYIGIPATDDWAIIYFYTQDPADIPTDFNLLTFFDFRALQYGISFTGNGWFQPGNFVPYLQIIKGNGHVKFWVITRAQADAAVADGNFTMAELESLNPIKGEATRFSETLRPFGGGAPVNGLLAHARGWLNNGKRFSFKAHSHFPHGSTEHGFFRTKFKMKD